MYLKNSKCFSVSRILQTFTIFCNDLLLDSIYNALDTSQSANIVSVGKILNAHLDLLYLF